MGRYAARFGFCASRKREFVQTKIRNLLSALLLDVAGEETGIIKNNAKEIDRVLDYIHQNIQKNLDMEEIAEIMNLSMSRFKAVFTETVGIPPREYIVRKKLQRCEQGIDGAEKIHHGDCIRIRIFFQPVFFYGV